MAKPTVDLTSKSRILPDGRKFPKTPEPQIIKENFGSVEVVNSDKKKTVEEYNNGNKKV